MHCFIYKSNLIKRVITINNLWLEINRSKKKTIIPFMLKDLI